MGRIEEARRQGIDAKPANVISCVAPRVLQVLLHFELDAKDIRLDTEEKFRVRRGSWDADVSRVPA